MTYQSNISLKNFNTFGIDVTAEKFISINKIDDLKKVISKDKDILVLSGGSNLLLTQTIKKPVVHINLKGIEILNISKNEDEVYVKVQAGENWHAFVLWCLDNNFGGIENLSLIPGNVGTSPMQNIGAYGVELKDVFYELEALEISSGVVKNFNKNKCKFGYRESVFKNKERGKFVIVSVTFKLTKNNHKLNTSYGAIQDELKKLNIETPSIKNISDVVIKIRESKLPDPKKIGNSGSFFKNPVISNSQFKKIQIEHPLIPHYIIDELNVKIPAGWLIEESGLKGKRIGDAGVHKNQALVLVNYGNAKGEEIYKLAKIILNAVYENFSIALETEVNII